MFSNTQGVLLLTLMQYVICELDIMPYALCSNHLFTLPHFETISGEEIYYSI